MMIGFGDRVRTHEEVKDLFNERYRQGNDPIARSTVTKTFQRFRQHGTVKDLLYSQLYKITSTQNLFGK